MNEELVKIYNEELNDLRYKGEIFAEANPKIASRLKLAKGNIEDPLVGRLLESFAFLTARLRYQVQAEFKQLDYHMAQLLYPHFFLPLPAYSTIQLTSDDNINSSVNFPSKKMLSTPLPHQGECYFSLVYPVTVSPLLMTKIRYQRDAIVPAQKTPSNQLKSCLTFTLEVSDPKILLGKLFLSQLRIFLNFDEQKIGKVYELFASHVKEILIRADSQQKAINVPVENLQPVGFNSDENMLPYPPNSFSGYRLLTEYFAYPEKFNYFDFLNLADYITESAEESVTFYLFFDRYFSDLEDLFKQDTLLLNCVPIVNLFETLGETINFDHTRHEYQVIPTLIKDPKAIEVYMVNDLSISSIDKVDQIDCLPYFSRRIVEVKENYLYWAAQRKSCESLGQVAMEGDEVFINISDIKLDEFMTDLKLTPQLICSNRNAAIHLPFGGGKPEWKFSHDESAVVKSIQCIKPITGTKYRQYTQQLRAELVQHIYLNQVGLIDGEQTLDALRTILKLYSFGEQQGRKLIETGIIAVVTKPITLRHPDSLHQGFCRGIEYKITIDETAFTYQNMYLFGCIVHEFLSKSCSINSFVTLILESTQRGVIQQWKPKFGKKAIL